MSEEREHAYRTPDSAQDSSQWSCFAAGLCFRCMGCERKWACVLLRDQDVVVWVVLLYIGFVHSLFLDMSCKIVAAATATVDCINVCANYGWQHGV